MSNNIFTRPEKVISGVCSHLALKYSIKPLILRIIFIIVTLLLIPILGILLYFILAISNGKIMKKVTFAIIGAILGIPLSYYFQSEMVKSKMGGIGGYLKNFDKILDNSDLIGNVILSVVIFAIVGGLVGYFIDENEAKKTK